jgi:hypothetical protein
VRDEDARLVGMEILGPPKTFDELIEYCDKLTAYDPDRSVRRLGFLPSYMPAAVHTMLTYGWAFGGSFYDEATESFTADDRVDFRDLVRDLAHDLKARIELRHIQVRDKAKIVAGPVKQQQAGREWVMASATVTGQFAFTCAFAAKDGQFIGAILVAPEYWWLESGSSNNVEIRDNTIAACRVRPILVQAHGGEGLISGKPAPSGAHNNLTIAKNVISDSPLPNIEVTSTDGSSAVCSWSDRAASATPGRIAPPMNTPSSETTSIVSAVPNEATTHALLAW